MESKRRVEEAGRPDVWGRFAVFDLVRRLVDRFAAASREQQRWMTDLGPERAARPGNRKAKCGRRGVG